MNVRCKRGDGKPSIREKPESHDNSCREKWTVIWTNKFRSMANSNLDLAIWPQCDSCDRPMASIFIYNWQLKKLRKVKNFSN